MWLNPAALRTALIYLESPCDLGQQICGIRPVARMLRNASQSASCTSQPWATGSDQARLQLHAGCCMAAAGFVALRCFAAPSRSSGAARPRSKLTECFSYQEGYSSLCSISLSLSPVTEGPYSRCFNPDYYNSGTGNG